MTNHANHQAKGHYGGLVFEMVTHFVIMYLVMYTMIATLDHFYLNINNLWMTLMMVTPMALIMMLTMRSMFPDRALNLAIGAAAILVFAASYWGMRTQAAVGDEQFVRSMIPHHSGAILMCEKASLTDPELVALCRQIIDTQRQEIAQMQGILRRY